MTSSLHDRRSMSMTKNENDHGGTSLTAVAAVSVSVSDQRSHADTIERVARSIFSWRYPQAGWDENLWAGHRDDCLLMAAQFRELFLQGVQIEPVYLWTIPSGEDCTEAWRVEFVKRKLADVLAEVAAGVPLKSLDPTDRACVKVLAEDTVNQAVDYFTKDITNG